MIKVHQSRLHERGIALITVLMLVAIIASIAAIMLMREQTLLEKMAPK